ncbi:hypothetical protein B0H13DRAFT_2365412 [Mycena leptocephala]|nr:hypothetical protein B0H13DRAFT_2365412 [Mycena leptocephala]
MSTAQINASAPVLLPGVGYGIVLLGFAVLMLAITKLTTRYVEHSASESSEEYTSASRSLKPGLIASGMFLQSKATWAATLLQASTVCLVYGLSGPWWYAAGSSTQINAIQLKAIIFVAACSLTSQLITGWASTVNALTEHARHLLPYHPVGVVIYTPFFSDYIHTVAIFSIILAVSFRTFATNETLGSPSKVYDLLQIAAENYPVGDAAGGSYTTMRSLNGFGFDVVAMVSGRVASIVCFHPRAFKISGQVCYGKKSQISH